MSQFHTLSVSKITSQTSDTVSVAFEIPTELKQEFEYTSGQYLTLKFNINGKEERRAYSLCSSPFTDDLHEVAVKKVENGIVSTYINDVLKRGDVIEVMPPQGGFVIKPSTSNNKHYVGFAAGSGITPIISMIKTVLSEEPNSKFTLVYGNKTKDSTIFRKELNAIESSNFDLISIYSREQTGDALTEGRIDKTKAIALFKEKSELLKADGFYMCGPEEMIVATAESLKDLGVADDKVHYELFTTPVLLAQETKQETSNFEGAATVTVIYDDEEVEFTLNADGDTILDAAMENDVDVPFSCKGAVCCTCKALVTEGKAIMTANYSLSESEVEEGYILTCQAHPASEKVVVDFDEA
ncbi:MAG: FAD-binding oxidoreductase [Flavobacteriales bacterium]|jgi:ring-1,2-phenylacetyl-CoA epoxidase subunit PaaE|nr:FAD-binding oxidoreductase [Flavobacteriales bacterium]